jgi:hypothetical protein
MAISQPPAPDEIEVCVLGPGTGEAILVHCTEKYASGDGPWSGHLERMDDGAYAA